MWRKTSKIIMDGIDTEYLVQMISQIRCKNNGIKSHLSKKSFQIDGIMINDDHLSFEYLREKSQIIDMLLDTICRDILTKSGMFRKLKN